MGDSRELTISHWRATSDQPLRRETVGEALRAAAAEAPDQVALVDGAHDPAGRRRWTYADMLAAAERVAMALLARYEPGDRLAVWEANRPEWVLLQLGAALAGVVVVTVNPQYRRDELRYALEQSGAKGVFHGDIHRGVSMRDLVHEVAPELPRLEHVHAFADWEEFCADARNAALPERSPEDPLLIIYTSGTTGFAKGVLLHHLGALNAARFSAARSGFGAGDVWINPIPLFHTGGGVLGTLGAITRQGAHVVVPEFDPKLVLELMESEKGSLIVTVPTILRALLDHPSRPDRDLSSMKTIMCGGSTVPQALVQRTKQVVGCDFAVLFGQAELHGVLTQTHPTDSAEDQAETLGRPMPHMEVAVADLDTGDPVPIGEQGEIRARGYQAMIGYHDMPSETSATLCDDGWLRTGDAGTMDSRGFLRIAGRIKDIIIRGGENIHPLEIEEVLLQRDDVAEVAVIGTPDEHWGEQVAAVLRVAEDSDTPTAEELHDYCREHLARFKTPRAWYVVDDFPMTASGKIQKFVLRDMAERGEMVILHHP